MIDFLGRYAKACVPLLVPLGNAVRVLVESGTVDRTALGLVAYGAVISLGVALTPNAPHTDPPGPVKAIPIRRHLRDGA